MPGPLSVTVSSTPWAGETDRPVVTVVPGGVWVRALERRFASTWWRRSASPRTVTGSAGSSSCQLWAWAEMRESLTASRTSLVRSTSESSRGRPASRRASRSRSWTRTVMRSASDSTRLMAWAISGGTSALLRRVSSA